LRDKAAPDRRRGEADTASSKLSPESTAETADSNVDATEYNRGRIIGELERVLLVALVFLDQFFAISSCLERKASSGQRNLRTETFWCDPGPQLNLKTVGHKKRKKPQKKCLGEKSLRVFVFLVANKNVRTARKL
jgi:hypothetical protein